MDNKKSLIDNYLYNLIKTLSSIAFPVITFVYSARILGVDGLGKVNFSKSVISYFTMIAVLGMNYYGTREAAKLRNDKKKFSHFVHEMLIINTVSTIVSYILFMLAVRVIHQLQDYTILLVVNSFSIVLTGMGMEWMYQALEEYRYIAIRAVVFQGIALILMLFTVKTPEDVVNYAIVLVVATTGSYLLNFINSKKYVIYRWYGHYKIKHHLKSIFWLFALTVSIELYTVLDSTMLGFLKGDTAVGLYTAAVKINRIVNTLITSLGVVLIPRLSYYIGKGEMSRVKELVESSYQLIFMFSIPACLGLFALSDDFILLFSGEEFTSAGFTMRLLTPIVLVIPFSVVTNQQTLVPLGKEKLILISTCVGAVTNFTFNMLLIPRFAENGAAAATVLAEIAVALVCMAVIKKYFKLTNLFKQYYQYWLAAIPIILVKLCVEKLKAFYAIQMLIIIALSVIVYFGLLGLMRNLAAIQIYRIIKLKFTNILKGKIGY